MVAVSELGQIFVAFVFWVVVGFLGFFLLTYSFIYLLVRLDSRVGVVPVKVLCKNRPSSVNVIFTHLVNLARKTSGLWVTVIFDMPHKVLQHGQYLC